jgi:hypothetical protein
MVLSAMRSLMSLALIRIKQCVMGWASGVFASAYTILLCRFVLSCLCVYWCNMIVGGGMCHFVGILGAPPTYKPPLTPNPNVKVQIIEFTYCNDRFPATITN